MLTLLLTSMLTLAFNVQPLKASGTIYIRADGSVDPPTAPIQQEGDLYIFANNIYNSIVVERDNVVIDGNDYTLQGTGKGSGFDLSVVSNVTVKNTILTHFENGIIIFYFEGSTPTGRVPVHNTIVNNTITNCSQYGVGIYIWDSTCSDYEHCIIDNTIRNNWIGVALEGNTRYTKVYHNNFLNNTYQAYDVTGQTNWWNNSYPSGGNYWSDHTGVDGYIGPYQNITGSDGISDTPYTIDENNSDNYPLMKPYAGSHDIGTTMSISKTIIREGDNTTVIINVTVINYGEQTENFNLTFQTNTTIQEQELTVTSRNSTALTFRWNTTGLTKGNYMISAQAEPVLGETDITDNTFTGWIMVAMLCDITGPDGVPDGKVDMRDIGTATQAFGSYPGHERWNPIADINNDNKVDMKDIGTVAKEFGKTV